MSKEKMTLREFAIARGASSKFVDWFGARDLAEAWATCRRSDWMMWLLLALGWDDYHAQREYAWWCATQVRHLMTDPRSTECLDVVRKYLDGECGKAERKAATAAARKAATAAARKAATAAGPDAAAAALWTVAAWLAAAEADVAAAEAAASWSAEDSAVEEAAADASWAAARAASWAARAASWAARAASWAAEEDSAEARVAQADRLRQLVPVAVVQALFKQATGGSR